MTSDTLRGIYLPIGLPPSYWNTQIPKASLFELVSLVAGSAESITVTPTGNLTSINVQDALEELQEDIDLLISGSLPSFTKTFGDILTDTVNAGEHGLPAVHSVLIKTPADEIVSVKTTVIGTTVTIDSNISLLNHKLLIY
jgi:hypothetical protein